MTRLIFMLEEPSMATLLEGLLPRLFPNLAFRCVPHEGKSDLEQSLPRKLRHWRTPGDRFVVIRDSDGADCRSIKSQLVQICQAAGRSDALVRIACQELEAWYFGQPNAMALAFNEPRLGRVGGRAAYRNPDAIKSPSKKLRQLHATFQKVDGARQMAAHLTYADNVSPSFRVLIEGIDRLVKACASSRDDAQAVP